MSKYLYVPIEIINRDLDGRLLIALQALKKQFKVVIGKQAELKYLAPKLPVGVYLGKSASIADWKNFDVLKQIGHKVAVLDEEAIVHQNEEAHIKSRCSEKTMPLVDAVFTWGDYDFRVITNMAPSGSCRLYKTGNPRIDLLRSELRNYYLKEKLRLEKKYGPFIMIPSSFAMCNHYSEAGPRIEWRRSMGMINSHEDVRFYTEYANHFDKIFQSFLGVIPLLAKKFPGYTFIVRPHPSENVDVWLDRFKGVGNVKVIYEGAVIPWLFASKLVIHNGCTTGIEAFLLDKDVVSYRPYVSDKYDLNLPNDVSRQAFSYEELKCLMSDLLRNDQFLPEYRTKSMKILGEFVDSMEGKLSSDKIIDVLDRLSMDVENDVVPYFGVLYVNYRLNLLHYNIKRMLRQLLGGRFITKTYGGQKFPGLRLADLRERINKHAFMKDDGDIVITKVFGNCFLLECPEKNNSVG